MNDQNMELLNLKSAQLQQQIDQYRSSIYNLELRMDLLNRMLEEKGILAKGEFSTRWPQYLKNDIGVLENDGKMKGTLKITFYGKK